MYEERSGKSLRQDEHIRGQLRHRYSIKARYIRYQTKSPAETNFENEICLI